MQTHKQDPGLELAHACVRECAGTAASTRGVAAREFAAGRWIRLRPGFYVERGQWAQLNPLGRFWCVVHAQQRARPDTVFVGETALVLQGMQTLVSPVHVEIADRSGAHAGLRPSTFADRVEAGPTVAMLPPRLRAERRTWSDESVARHHGFLVVAPEVALVQAATRLKFPRALTLADGVAAGRHDLRLSVDDAIETALDQVPTAWERRRALTVLQYARGESESPGESMSRAVILALGFPEPELQLEYVLPQGSIARADFGWPQWSLLGEFDGMGKYVEGSMLAGRSTGQAILAERERARALESLGWRLVRWEWPVASDPAKLRGVLLRAGLPQGGMLPDVVL